MSRSVRPSRTARRQVSTLVSAMSAGCLAGFKCAESRILTRGSIRFGDLKRVRAGRRRLGLKSVVSSSCVCSMRRSRSCGKAPISMTIIPDNYIHSACAGKGVAMRSMCGSFSLKVKGSKLTKCPLVSICLANGRLGLTTRMSTSISSFVAATELCYDKLGFAFGPRQVVLGGMASYCLAERSKRQVRVRSSRLCQIIASLCAKRVLNSMVRVSCNLLGVRPGSGSNGPVRGLRSRTVVRNSGRLGT